MSARVLVLGAAGMLGHKVVQHLAATGHDVWGTVRQEWEALPPAARRLLPRARTVTGLDVQEFAHLASTVERLDPAVVVNCVGIVKQRAAAHDAIASITINALLPHRLAALLHARGSRLIHFSTDCVFDGVRGDYSEGDVTNATDLYGRTKALGEVTSPRALTIRTSMIGRELTVHQSLLDWFLAQNHGTVRGFTRAIYAGVTTPYLADVVRRLIAERPELQGLYQVAAAPISKHDLLVLLRDAYGLDVTIVPDDTFVCDRSMRGDRFERETGYRCPDWPTLCRTLAQDPTPYDEWISE
jgi:dTDP-4-dehydrorhamnose reductase